MSNKCYFWRDSAIMLYQQDHGTGHDEEYRN